MRAFVALEISEEGVLKRLVAIQRDLSATGADVKLVEEQNLHFTVKFLGEISEADCKEADRRLKGLSLKGTEVQMRGIGAFPSPGNPRVVWAGVSGTDEGKVRAIAEPAISALQGIGESDSRPFQAHLTLARVRSARNRSALAFFLRSNADKAIGTVRLGSMKLKSSVLTPHGPIYEDVGEYMLT